MTPAAPAVGFVSDDLTGGLLVACYFEEAGLACPVILGAEAAAAEPPRAPLAVVATRARLAPVPEALDETGHRHLYVTMPAAGVSFVSVTQAFNTTSSMGRQTLSVLLSFAQFEREVTAERIRDKIAASKRKGMWVGGLPPLGYDLKDRALAVNEAEAETVRMIFRRYLDLGCVRALKADLNATGVVSKRRAKGSGGKPISRGALYELLRNPVYVGETRHKGERHPGMYEAILDRETWDAVQPALCDNGGGKRSGAPRS
ncbi:recombinase family protein [Albimonas sp. CAU 1670]|uniref:recombinase family protein n=1 Tax=Albimonas sp. CAU 1670 TaxID=3032599 RepID=UPI0023DB09A9|nr:recombinase family protein [Albimonas sp. CAU 1670]MDF2235720.1 recombinase family protein [Albimonas sp. CAU 1670]